jgi:hypothetical protein
MESNSLRQDLKHSIADEVDNTSAGYLKFKGPGRSLHDNRNWQINMFLNRTAMLFDQSWINIHDLIVWHSSLAHIEK